MNAEPVIRIRGVRTQFGPVVVHENLDLDVRRGEILGVVGGSGTIRGPRAQAVGFHTGDTLLIPAAFEGRAEFDRECVFLEASIPG